MSAASQKWNDAVWFFTGIVTAVAVYIALSGDPKDVVHKWQELLSLLATLFAGILAYIGIQRQISQQYDAERKRQAGLASYLQIAARQYEFDLLALASDMTTNEHPAEVEDQADNKNIYWPPSDFAERVAIPPSLQLRPEEFAHMNEANKTLYIEMHDIVQSIMVSYRVLMTNIDFVDGGNLQGVAVDMVHQLQSLIKKCNSFESGIVK